MDEDVKISGNQEIEKALAEFKAKSAMENQKPFSQEKNYTDLPKMVRLVMKYSGGAIKEQKQAEYVLLGFVALMLAISLYFFLRGGNEPPPVPTPLQNVGQLRVAI